MRHNSTVSGHPISTSFSQVDSWGFGASHGTLFFFFVLCAFIRASHLLYVSTHGLLVYYVSL